MSLWGSLKTKSSAIVSEIVNYGRGGGGGGDRNATLIYKKIKEAILNSKQNKHVANTQLLLPQEPHATLVEKILDKIVSWQFIVAAPVVAAGVVFLALRLRANDPPADPPANLAAVPEELVTAEVVAGSAAWLGRGLSCVCAQSRQDDSRLSLDMTPAQGNCLMKLQNRLHIAYDSSVPEHQDALRALWKAAFPEEELYGLITEQWKEMGWQGKDPSTDFRGNGFISLENLLYFARNFPNSFQDLLRKQEGDRSMREYPFAVAGVNITFMLIQMLDLEAEKPRTLVGSTFLKFLSDDESAFDLLYCIAFKLMDHQWLMIRASDRNFNAVMKSTRRQLERELLEEGITRVEELPSYALLT